MAGLLWFWPSSCLQYCMLVTGVVLYPVLHDYYTILYSGRKFWGDNPKSLSGQNPPDKDLELLLAEIGECLLWRYLVSPRSTLAVARLFLSPLVFILPTSSLFPLLPPSSSSHGPTLKRLHWNGGPFHLCHSSILLWYVLISPNQPSWNSSEDFVAMCTASTPSLFSRIFWRLSFWPIDAVVLWDWIISLPREYRFVRFPHAPLFLILPFFT